MVIKQFPRWIQQGNFEVIARYFESIKETRYEKKKKKNNNNNLRLQSSQYHRRLTVAKVRNKNVCSGGQNVTAVFGLLFQINKGIS